jgi:hemoglobin
MSQSNSARVGLIVLAIAVVAGVGVFVWSSRSDDSDDSGKGGDAAKGADERARLDKERQRVPSTTPDKGGNEAAGETTAPPPTGDSLHDRIGGREAIHAMTGKLLEAVQTNEVMMANEEIMERAKNVNVRELHQRITNYVCREAGGPCKYTGRPMKDYIVPLKLTPTEWNAAAKDVADVLTEMKVPDQEAEKLMAIFAGLRDDSLTPE